MTQQAQLSDFMAIKDELVSLLEPLDEERMNQVPFPGSWTAGQLGEHDLSFTCPEFGVIGFGDLTALEWIRFLTAHSKRHVRQLRNLLSHI